MASAQDISRPKPPLPTIATLKWWPSEVMTAVDFTEDLLSRLFKSVSNLESLGVGGDIYWNLLVPSKKILWGLNQVKPPGRFLWVSADFGHQSRGRRIWKALRGCLLSDDAVLLQGFGHRFCDFLRFEVSKGFQLLRLPGSVWGRLNFFPILIQAQSEKPHQMSVFSDSCQCAKKTRQVVKDTVMTKESKVSGDNAVRQLKTDEASTALIFSVSC